MKKVPQVTDLHLIELALEHGFGTELNEPVQSEQDVVWYDTDPMPMLRELRDLLQPAKPIHH